MGTFIRDIRVGIFTYVYEYSNKQMWEILLSSIQGHFLSKIALDNKG